MKRTITSLSFLAFSLILSFNLYSQDTIRTTAGSASICQGNTVIIPVYVSNLNDVGSISLKLNYDSTKLVYQGYQNPHQELGSGFLVVNGSTNEIAFAWFTFNAANIATGVLIEYIFTCTGGASSLNWDTVTPGNCQYSRTDLSIIPALFFDGTVSCLGPGVSITTQPADISVDQGTPASFSVVATGANSYQWQVDRNDGNGFDDCIDGGIFNGSLTAILNISSTSLAMNGWKFQCIVNGSCDSIISDNATLTVIPIFDTIVTIIDSIQACTGDQIIIPVRVTNFIDVSSMSHTINFDNTVLTYAGYQNVNPALGGFFMANGYPGGFSASWFILGSGKTIPDGILYEMIFTYNGGNTCLQWNLSQPSNNQYGHQNSLVFPAIWIDGCVEDISPIVDAGPDQAIGFNTATILSGSATGGTSPYSWSWTPATMINGSSSIQNPTTVQLTVSQLYTLTVTDANGCTSSDDVLITLGTIPFSVNPVATPDTICLGTSTQLYANPVGGDPNYYTFSWVSIPPGFTSTQQDPVVSPSVTTTYIVTLDDGFATVTDSVTVTVIPAPLANAGPDATICEDETYTLTGTVSNQSSVLWTTSGAGVFDDATLPGATYTPGVSDIATGSVVLTLTATGAHPCTPATSTMTLYIQLLPFANAGPDATICINASYTMNGAATNQSAVLWSTTGDGTFNDASFPGATYTPGALDIAIGSVVLTFYANPTWPCSTSSTSTMTLYIQNTLQVNLGNDTTISINNPLSLDAGYIGGTYLWSNSATTQSIVVSSPIDTTINYSVTVTDNGCVGIDSINVTYISQTTLITKVDSVTFCQGGTLIVPVHVENVIGVAEFSLNLNIDPTIFSYSSYQNIHPAISNGGLIIFQAGATINFTWIDSVSSATIPDGILFELVFNAIPGNSCMIWDTLTSYYSDTSGASIPASWINGCSTNSYLIADAGPDQTIAFGTSTILDGTVTGGSGMYTYSWSPDSLLVDPYVEDPQTTPLTICCGCPGIYFSLTAIDINSGCISNSDTVNIILVGYSVQADPEASPDTICQGDSSQLLANPCGGSGSYSFIWSSNPPGFTSTMENPTVSPTDSTWYIVKVFDGFNDYTDSVLITVVPIANAGHDATICEDAAYTLSGSAVGQSSVLWTTSGDGTFNDATLLGAIYTPGVNDIANGSVVLILLVNASSPCTGNAIDHMTLFIQLLPLADAGADATICDNDSYTLPGTASNQSSILWTSSGDGTFDDATNPGATYTPGPADILAGSVVLSLTSGATWPCSTSAISNMILTINPSPIVNLGTDTTICFYNTVTLYAGNPGSTYIWSTGDTTESITVSSPTPNSIIHYYVTVTDNNGCNGMDDIYVTFDDCVSLEEIGNGSSINIFPNPTGGKLKIQISNVKTDIEMQIMNIHGQKILRDKFEINSSLYNKVIDLSKLPKGVYFISFRNNSILKVEKIILQ